ncbi:MAG TPA: DUF2020 domain-containing protein [Pseudonocardiaceae bacterium]
MSPSRGRWPAVVVAAGLLLFTTGACGQWSGSPAGVESSPTTPPPPTWTPPPVAPPAPQPVGAGPCPYLSAAAVESANGEHVGAVRISADRPHPACFFLAGGSAGERVQLRTWIVVATPEVARATVDAAAPVATSDLAELPGGWSGGSQPTADGAVFAVAREGTAVVVTTNQQRTISARRIAEQVILALRAS